jgi:hypothetical protein
LLGPPREVRDQILRQLFHIAPTIVVEEPEDNAYASPDAFRILQPLPMHVLCTNKQLHVEAKRKFSICVRTARLVMNCYFPALLRFFDSIPLYIKANIKRMYITSKLLHSYSQWTKFAWRRQTNGAWSPICQKILENFALEELAIYVPFEAAPHYSQEAALEICHLLETAKIQRVQLDYWDTITAYNQDCDIPQVQRVLRGAYAYFEEKNRRERRSQFLASLAEWRKLPEIFNVQREDKGARRDELWWAADDVLAKNYSADLLKHNGVRTIITLTGWDD